MYKKEDAWVGNFPRSSSIGFGWIGKKILWKKTLERPFHAATASSNIDTMNKRPRQWSYAHIHKAWTDNSSHGSMYKTEGSRYGKVYEGNDEERNGM